MRLIYWRSSRLLRVALVCVFQVDADLLQKQQEAYKVEGVDEDEQVTAQQLKKKRKQQNANEVRVPVSLFLQQQRYPSEYCWGRRLGNDKSTAY